MRILIAGSHGQVGTQIVKDLKKGTTDLGELPANLKNAEVLSMGRKELDITNQTMVQEFILREKPDIIINCGAFVDADACEKQVSKAMQINALGPRNLAIAASSVNAKFLQVSTDYVFHGDEQSPRKEWDICRPLGVYGYAKMLGEQYTRDFCNKWFVVRTAWLYGYTGKNFIKTIMQIAKEKGELTVVNDQIGTPTNVVDLSYHILKIVSGEEYGIYHGTNNGVASWYDFACKILKLSGIPCKISPCTSSEFARSAKRPAYSVLENLMLKSTIGDDFRLWEDALEDFYMQTKFNFN